MYPSCMNDNVIELGPHERMNAREALAITMRESPEEVVILFHDANGKFGMRTSGMLNKDALWALECAKRYLLEGKLR